MLVSEWTEELLFEVESAWISGRDFTVVFYDAPVGWRENWRVSTQTSWPPKASRWCFTKTGKSSTSGLRASVLSPTQRGPTR
jgi:hypothetical protein